jgi:hypothetical protein
MEVRVVASRISKALVVLVLPLLVAVPASARGLAQQDTLAATVTTCTSTGI